MIYITLLQSCVNSTKSSKLGITPLIFVSCTSFMQYNVMSLVVQHDHQVSVNIILYCMGLFRTNKLSILVDLVAISIQKLMVN